MLKIYETPDDEPVPPECRASVARIQSALDGDTALDTIDTDPHLTACSACRERVRAARVLLAVLATPPEPVAVPAGFSDRVVNAMWTERHARTRRNVYKAIASLALAAAVLIAAFAIFSPPSRESGRPEPLPLGPPAETVQQTPEVAPQPREKLPPAPEPRPIRFGDAVANTSQAIRDTPRPFAESVAVAPKLFDALTGPFKLPAPPADPMATALEPARKSLAELPVAARVGFEPVTGTAEKAFARFLRDVGSVKPNS